MGATILEGNWKYYQGFGLIPDALFNLKEDPMEKMNVLKKDPELAKRLDDKLTHWLQANSAKMPLKTK